jgi:hypothetical protein
MLVGQGVRLCYTSQTLAEFWNASTRPLDKNGFGLSVAETDRLARVIGRDFELLPDSREVHDRWRSLRVAHNVQGVQVHDARLAASMFDRGASDTDNWQPATALFTPHAPPGAYGSESC